MINTEIYNWQSGGNYNHALGQVGDLFNKVQYIYRKLKDNYGQFNGDLNDLILGEIFLNLKTIEWYHTYLAQSLEWYHTHLE